MYQVERDTLLFYTHTMYVIRLDTDDTSFCNKYEHDSI